MTYETVGVSTSTSAATVIAHSGSANVKSDWVELDASTAFTVDGFWVWVSGNTDSTFDYFIDIGIGADMSETVLIPDVLYSTGDTNGSGTLVYFPISIASGTRISARQQNYATSATIRVAVILTTDSGLDVTAFTTVDVMGALTSSDTSGTLIDPGGTPNAKNSPYVEIKGSTANTYKAFIIIIGQNRNSGLGNAGCLFDVAIGGADSEVDFLSNLSFSNGIDSDKMEPRVFGPFACDIPSSSRLSVRAQSSTSNTPNRLFDIVLYGIH